MSRWPLHTLPAFRVVARTQNLRAAAEQLHLTHSALSQQIKLLESQLELALFDRVGRRLQLNAAGRALLLAVDGALQQLDDGLRSAQAAQAAPQTRVRLTLTPSFAQRWLLPRMARWRDAHPEFSLELVATQRLVDLAGEGVDAAVRQGPGPWRGLQAEPLIQSPLIAVAPPETAARLQALPLAAMAEEPLLGDAETWQRWFARGGATVTPRPVASFNDAGHLLQAAEHGIGIALARALLAADALRDGRLVQLHGLALDGTDRYPYWLVYPPERASSPALQALRRWIRHELRLSAQALARAGLGGVPEKAATLRPGRAGRAAARR